MAGANAAFCLEVWYLRSWSSVVPLTSAQVSVIGLACAFVLGVAPAAGAPSHGTLQGQATAQERVKHPTLQRVDGGPGYHGRFSNALPTRPSFFPIAVWFASATSQADINKDKNAGLNTYVVLTRNSNLALLRRNGMKTVLQHEEWRPGTATSAETVGWELHDEIDMEMSPAEGHATLQRMLGSLPADRRLRYNNFGKGVMFWESDAEAEAVRERRSISARTTSTGSPIHMCAGAPKAAVCWDAAARCRRRNAAELRTTERPFSECAAW